MSPDEMIAEYLAGPQLLRQAVDGMSAADLDATPVPGKWSTRQVVAHIADFEPIYADRIKRVIAQEQPTFFGGDPDLFADRLAYSDRDIEQELQLITAVRRHLATILHSQPANVYERTGIHSEDGPLSIRQLLQNITRHIPHHIKFIEEKRDRLKA